MKKVKWAKNMYCDWRNYRNSRNDLESSECDLDDINTLTKEQLNRALCRFITEVRKVDGLEYPSRTLYDIIICVQFWLETQGLSWRFLVDEEFKELKFTLDNVMKDRVAHGVDAKVRKAGVLDFQDEELLWSLCILGTHSPQVLINTVVFSFGLYCALRAGKEHRSLRSVPFNSQFQFLNDSNGETFLRYTEDPGLKTNKERIKHRKIEPKVVDVWPTQNEHCPVKLLQYYMTLLPTGRKSESQKRHASQIVSGVVSIN